jgi:hypothetical protein
LLFPYVKLKIEFIKEDEINLTGGVRYGLTDMAVTSDNKLLLCNSSDKKVHIYKDYETYEDKISFTRQPYLYLIGQGRVICDSDPIVSMLTFLISLNSMSISLIADDMS